MKRTAVFAHPCVGVLSSLRRRRSWARVAPIEAMEPRFLLAVSDWLTPAGAATYDQTTGTYTLATAATLFADPGAEAPKIRVEGAGAHLTIDPADGNLDIHVGALDIADGAKVTVASLGADRSEANHRVLVIESDALTIDNGWLDLTDNDLILDFDGDLSEATATAVRALLAGGYNGGGWDGFGITSSLADYSVTLATAGNDQLEGLFLGFGDGDTGSLFAGQVVDTSTVLVKFTFMADLDLNGRHDFQDLSLFNGNYDAGATNDNPYVEGDMTYDGLLDFQDLSLFNGSYNPTVNVPAEEAPVLGLDGPGTVEVEVGQPISVTGTYMDVNGQAVTLGVNGNVGTITKNTGTSSGKWTWTHPAINTPVQNMTVTLKADDDDNAANGYTSRTISVMIRPKAPTNVTAYGSDANGETITVYWMPSAAAETYNVYVSTTPNFTPSAATLLADEIVDPSYTTDGFDPTQSYYFSVTAAANGAESATNSANSGDLLQPRFVLPTAQLVYSPGPPVIRTAGTITTQRYDLEGFMAAVETAGDIQQCNDNANLLTMFARSLGINMQSQYLRSDAPPSPLEPATYYAAGETTESAAVLFNFHQFGHYGGLIYDPSTRKALTGDPTMGLSMTDYLNTTFPGQIAAGYDDFLVTSLTLP